MRLAFTLVEILVTIAILVVLMGILLAAVPMVKQRAKVTVTSHRMQDLERAVIALGGETPAAGLQDRLVLGGVARFEVLERVMAAIRPASGYTNHDVYPPVPSFANVHWGDEATTRQRWVRMYFEDLGASWWEWRKGRSSYQAIREVMPPEGTITTRTWWFAAWPSLWPRSDWDQDTPGTVPPILRFPWGRPGLRRDGTPVDPGRPATDVVDGVPNAWVAGADLPSAGRATTISWAASETSRPVGSTAQTNPLPGLPVVYRQRSDGSDAYTTFADIANRPEPFDAGLMSPLASARAVVAAGICDDLSTYRSDRNPSKPWNDAWGRPLIVATALFQPERFITDDPEAWTGHAGRVDHRYYARDRMLSRCQAVYGFSRTVYLCVGAIGPEPGADLSAAWNGGTWDAAAEPRVLRESWLRIRDIGGAVAWDETAFTDPPWNGVKSGKRGRALSLLTAPVEIR